MVATFWCWQYWELSFQLPSYPLPVLLACREYFFHSRLPLLRGRQADAIMTRKGQQRSMQTLQLQRTPNARLSSSTKSAFQCALLQQSSVCRLKSTWAVGQVSLQTLEGDQGLGQHFYYSTSELASPLSSSDLFLMTDVDSIFSRCTPLYINRIPFQNQDGTATLHCVMIEVLLSQNWIAFQNHTLFSNSALAAGAGKAADCI